MGNIWGYFAAGFSNYPTQGGDITGMSPNCLSIINKLGLKGLFYRCRIGEP